MIVKQLQIVTAFKKMKVCSTNNVQRERRVKFTGEFVLRSELDSTFFQLEGKKKYVYECLLISMQIQ